MYRGGIVAAITGGLAAGGLLFGAAYISNGASTYLSPRDARKVLTDQEYNDFQTFQFGLWMTTPVSGLIAPFVAIGTQKYLDEHSP